MAVRVVQSLGANMLRGQLLNTEYSVIGVSGWSPKAVTETDTRNGCVIGGRRTPPPFVKFKPKCIQLIASQ